MHTNPLSPTILQHFKIYSGNYLVFHAETLIRSGKAIHIEKRIHEHNSKYNLEKEQDKMLFYRNNAKRWNELTFFFGVSCHHRRSYGMRLYED
jgi:hypothetical protein